MILVNSVPSARLQSAPFGSLSISVALFSDRRATRFVLGVACENPLSARAKRKHLKCLPAAASLHAGHGKPGHAAPLDGEKDLSWKPGRGGQAAKERAKEMRKYAEQRALQKESEREARRSEKAAAERQLKEIKAAVTSLDISAEDVRPICRFFELGKCNKGAKCKFRHEAAAAAPEGGADAPAPGRAEFARRVPRYLGELARALRCLHEAGVVHRDVKLANAMISSEGRALLVDLGVGCELHSHGGEHSCDEVTGAGSPLFVCPAPGRVRAYAPGRLRPPPAAAARL